MSPKRPGSRNAIAGLGLAAAGVVFRRLSGRRQAAAAPQPPAPEPQTVDDAAVVKARSELAEELARRAASGDG